jgi:hypothetical protein
MQFKYQARCASPGLNEIAVMIFNHKARNWFRLDSQTGHTVAVKLRPPIVIKNVGSLFDVCDPRSNRACVALVCLFRLLQGASSKKFLIA